MLAVLVCPNPKLPAIFQATSFTRLEVVAMVLAEMNRNWGLCRAEGAAMSARHSQPVCCRGPFAKKGRRRHVWLHEPRVVVSSWWRRPVIETARLNEASDGSTRSASIQMMAMAGGEGPQHALKPTHVSPNSKGCCVGWRSIGASCPPRRPCRKRTILAGRYGGTSDAYLRERLSDLDDLSNRLLRILDRAGQTPRRDAADPILVGVYRPAELLEMVALCAYRVGSDRFGSHARDCSRGRCDPLIVHAGACTMTPNVTGSCRLVNKAWCTAPTMNRRLCVP